MLVKKECEKYNHWKNYELLGKSTKTSYEANTKASKAEKQIKELQIQNSEAFRQNEILRRQIEDLHQENSQD